MLPGELILAKYKVLRIIKDAQDGCILLVEHIDLNSYWIIKQLKTKSDKVIKEIDVLKGVRHDGVPLIIDVIYEDDCIFIIREYVEGQTLEEYVLDRGNISEQEAIQIGIDLCEIVEFLHDNKTAPIIVRDIKPSNIIITKDRTVKLIDFSIARYYVENRCRDTECLGTRGFAPPEAYSGRCDVQTDVFGVSATLYYSLTKQDLGKPPYQFQPITTLRKDLSRELERVLTLGCKLKKSERYKNIHELKAALKALIKIESTLSFECVLKAAAGYKVMFQGIKAGIGTTYMSLGLAKNLQSKGVKVVLMDFSESQHLMALEYQQSGQLVQGVLYYDAIPVISCYSMEKHSFVSAKQVLEEASMIIIDKGVDNHEGTRTCDGAMGKSTGRIFTWLTPEAEAGLIHRKIVISGASPWEIELLEAFMLDAIHEKIQYAINFTTNRQFKALKDSMPEVSFHHIPMSAFDEGCHENEGFWQSFYEGEDIILCPQKKSEIFSKIRKSKIKFLNNIKL